MSVDGGAFDIGAFIIVIGILFTLFMRACIDSEYSSPSCTGIVRSQEPQAEENEENEEEGICSK